MTGKKRGRPAKVIEPGSADVTVRLPNAVIALMESAMVARGIKQRGAFIRQLIEASGTLLPLLQEATGDMEEMRQMHRETKAMLRVIQTTQADLMRALDVEPAAELDDEEPTDFVDEINLTGTFAAEPDLSELRKPTW